MKRCSNSFWFLRNMFVAKNVIRIKPTILIESSRASGRNENWTIQHIESSDIVAKNSAIWYACWIDVFFFGKKGWQLAQRFVKCVRLQRMLSLNAVQCLQTGINWNCWFHGLLSAAFFVSKFNSGNFFPVCKDQVLSKFLFKLIYLWSVFMCSWFSSFFYVFILMFRILTVCGRKICAKVRDHTAKFAAISVCVRVWLLNLM